MLGGRAGGLWWQQGLLMLLELQEPEVRSPAGVFGMVGGGISPWERREQLGREVEMGCWVSQGE